VVTRLASSWDGWADTTIAMPAGSWIDLLTGRHMDSAGEVPLAGMLTLLPVALLTRTDE